jgi:hypothetical protein
VKVRDSGGAKWLQWRIYDDDFWCRLYFEVSAWAEKRLC